jgi:hypothetical protein
MSCGVARRSRAPHLASFASSATNALRVFAEQIASLAQRSLFILSLPSPPSSSVVVPKSGAICYRDPFSLRLMDGARSGSPPPVSSALPQICHGPFQPHLEHNAPVFGACSCWPKKLDPLFPTPFVTPPYIFSL